MIQFAAAVSSWIGERSPVRSIPRAQQVACGVAAAVAAAYHAPLAGVFFALEIVLGRWASGALPQLLFASTAGWFASDIVLGGGPLFPVHGVLSFSWQALWGVPLALALGAIGPLYQAMLRGFRFAGRWPLALVWGGLVVGALSLLRTEVWGDGDAALLHVLSGSATLSSIAVILVLRLFATAFCVGTGTIGGVFTPTLFAGAAVGLALGHLLQLSDPLLLAVVGLSALLSAVTHAPIMAAFMAAELTGQWHLLPLLLLLDVAAWRMALVLSPHSLYAIATPTPVEEVAVF